jgi:ribosomal protein L40E
MRRTEVLHRCLDCEAPIPSRARRCRSCFSVREMAGRAARQKAHRLARRAGSPRAEIPAQRAAQEPEPWLAEDYRPAPAQVPTGTAPGTRARVEVYRLRVEAGLTIFHPRDMRALDRAMD